jgi:DNA invertase Pin-like site-specific DNA recombinase
MATLERECMLQNQAEGIAVAKNLGIYKGRAPKKIDELKFKTMCGEWKDGKRTAVSIQREFDISAQTFYRWVKEKNL